MTESVDWRLLTADDGGGGGGALFMDATSTAAAAAAAAELAAAGNATVVSAAGMSPGGAGGGGVMFQSIDRYVTPVWYVLGIPGNLLAFCVWMQRKMRRSSGVYLASLALDEGLFLLMQVPASMSPNNASAYRQSIGPHAQTRENTYVRMIRRHLLQLYLQL